MKHKVLSLVVLSVIIYSCAPKPSAPTTEVKKTESAPAVTTAPEVTVTSAAPVATVMTPELAEGKSLYDNNCANCHKLYDAKDFSAEEWKPIVSRMLKKAHLDDLQGQKIYNYLTMN